MQTFITFFKNSDGNIVTFERWNCKRVSTVLNNVKYLLENDLYRALLSMNGAPQGIAETWKTDCNGNATVLITARCFN